MVRGLLVILGFTTFSASFEVLLRKGESHSRVLMQLFQVLVSGIGGDEIQVTRLVQQVKRQRHTSPCHQCEWGYSGRLVRGGSSWPSEPEEVLYPDPFDWRTRTSSTC